MPPLTHLSDSLLTMFRSEITTQTSLASSSNGNPVCRFGVCCGGFHAWQQQFLCWTRIVLVDAGNHKYSTSCQNGDADR